MGGVCSAGDLRFCLLACGKNPDSAVLLLDATAAHAVNHLVGCPREVVLHPHDILPMLGTGRIRTLWALG